MNLSGTKICSLEHTQTLKKKKKTFYFATKIYWQNLTKTKLKWSDSVSILYMYIVRYLEIHSEINESVYRIIAHTQIPKLILVFPL